MVPRHTFPGGVHEPKVGLCICNPLRSGVAIPAHGLGEVLRDASTIGVHGPEVKLGRCIAALSFLEKVSWDLRKNRAHTDQQTSDDECNKTNGRYL
jgi:hypothetical protein